MASPPASSRSAAAAVRHLHERIPDLDDDLCARAAAWRCCCVRALVAFGALLLRLQHLLFGPPSEPYHEVSASSYPGWCTLRLCWLQGCTCPRRLSPGFTVRRSFWDDPLQWKGLESGVALCRDRGGGRRRAHARRRFRPHRGWRPVMGGPSKGCAAGWNELRRALVRRRPDAHGLGKRTAASGPSCRCRRGTASTLR